MSWLTTFNDSLRVSLFSRHHTPIHRGVHRRRGPRQKHPSESLETMRLPISMLMLIACLFSYGSFHPLLPMHDVFTRPFTIGFSRMTLSPVVTLFYRSLIMNYVSVITLLSSAITA